MNEKDEPQRGDLRLITEPQGKRWHWVVVEYKYGFFDVENSRDELDWYDCADVNSAWELGSLEGKERTEDRAIRAGMYALYRERARRRLVSIGEQKRNERTRWFA